jgi:hypothetical protein
MCILPTCCKHYYCGGVSESTQVGAEESIRHSTLSHLFSLILFCPLPRGRIDLCDAWTGHRSADAERSTMLPVEHTLYAHLCFLRVAARRTNAWRSKPARAERARSWLGAGTTVSWWSRAVCGRNQHFALSGDLVPSGQNEWGNGFNSRESTIHTTRVRIGVIPSFVTPCPRT